ncbi:MAG TPA: hypothetical protein VGI64_23805, partial [Streptosporangiaceae bacterium]
MTAHEARVTRVNGPLVEVTGLDQVAMSDVIELGEHRLQGEAVTVRGDLTTVQAYDYTGGLAPGHTARSRAEPLSALLGPHLLGGIFDGVLRPLAGAPIWLEPGVTAAAAAGRQFTFRPAVTDGAVVTGGTTLGTVPTAAGIDYRVLVPPHRSGPVTGIHPGGPVPLQGVIATVGGTPVRLTSAWPVRQ